MKTVKYSLIDIKWYSCTNKVTWKCCSVTVMLLSHLYSRLFVFATTQTWTSVSSPPAGTTMWPFTTAETSLRPWWGSFVEKSHRLRSSPAAASSSSSLSRTMRRTGRDSPSDTRSSRQVCVRLWRCVWFTWAAAELQLNLTEIRLELNRFPGVYSVIFGLISCITWAWWKIITVWTRLMRLAESAKEAADDWKIKLCLWFVTQKLGSFGSRF